MINNNGLSYNLYHPKRKAIATMVVVHGMMEHKDRYDYFATKLSKKRIAVLTYDQRGHGASVTSENELGFFAKERGYKLLIQDCLDMVKIIKKEYPDLPCILFGHSMGSIVARSFTKRYDNEIQALILSGAPNYNNLVPLGHKLAQTIGMFKGKYYRSNLMKEMVLGQFNKTILDPKTPCDWISKSEKNVQAYLKDPLCQFNFTVSGYEDLLFGMKDMHDTMRWNYRNKDLAILFISGLEDPCVGGEKGLSSSVNTLKESGYDNIEIRNYANLRHEILNEVERDIVITDCLTWLNRMLFDK